MSSGMGVMYSSNLDDARVLQDLLEAQHYDYPQAYIDAFGFEQNSIVADLPVTLMDLHISSMSEMPFDPLHWDHEGNYIP